MTNYLRIALYEYLATADPASKGGLPYGKLYAGVFVVGFIAAVTLGSIAFYNSKRPVGWEDASRPNYVPEVKSEDEN